jgi:uncharacterized protein
MPAPALTYLHGIGFLDPDPPPPPEREAEYRPTSVTLLSTNRCNLRCIYCYADAGVHDSQEVSADLARAAIDRAYHNAVDLGREHFELTFHGGGEPTLAWQTMEQAVAHARAKDLTCRITMVSNGVWSRRQRDWITGNLDRVTISFDGAPETQDRQRPYASGKGSFEAVMDTIRGLDEMGFRYGIRMTALAPWRGRLARDVEFICRQTGCQSVQVEPAFNDLRGEYRSPSLEDSAEFAEAFMEAFQIAQQAGTRLTYSGARPWLLTSSFCRSPYSGLVVTPDGDLVTCYEITDRAHPLAGECTIGYLQEDQIAIHGPKRSAFLARIKARREACRDCFCYWHCAGDCHVKAFYPGADSNPDTSPRCATNRSITAQMLLWYISTSEDGVWRGDSKRTSAPGVVGEEEEE